MGEGGRGGRAGQQMEWPEPLVSVRELLVGGGAGAVGGGVVGGGHTRRCSTAAARAKLGLLAAGACTRHRLMFTQRATAPLTDTRERRRPHATRLHRRSHPPVSARDGEYPPGALARPSRPPSQSHRASHSPVICESAAIVSMHFSHTDMEYMIHAPIHDLDPDQKRPQGDRFSAHSGLLPRRGAAPVRRPQSRKARFSGKIGARPRRVLTVCEVLYVLYNRVVSCRQ